MKIAVIGATGLVGQKMLRVLEEQGINADRFIVAASKRSIGKKVHFKGDAISLVSVEEAIDNKPDIAIFQPVLKHHCFMHLYLQPRAPL